MHVLIIVVLFIHKLFLRIIWFGALKIKCITLKKIIYEDVLHYYSRKKY